ncbi:hypothetical protein ASG19_02335 [Rhizobium sp. Leaf306]|nr:hypothetical protein ASG19_02335 [Rhizobium sp. Leaf306]KQQ73981.1 hypothetical protein ASF70_09395 [Rhizobium sp. Leaf321]
MKSGSRRLEQRGKIDRLQNTVAHARAPVHCSNPAADRPYHAPPCMSVDICANKPDLLAEIEKFEC